MLKDTFTTLCLNYTNNEPKVENLWLEIKQHYTGKGRHYHNLHHLENMLSKLEECRDGVSDWDTLLFSLFYHDIIYKPTAKNNEEKSAEMAVTRLKELGCDIEMTAKCYMQIMATKSHLLSDDNDTNLFTDADLSILGCKWDEYREYCKQIRKEYKIYPDIIYKPGRKKVLEHFLQMEHIFKTSFFRDRYETNARKNLMHELEIL